MAQVNIPSNSKASKEVTHRFEKAATPKAKTVKKSGAKKLADIFIQGDVEQVRHTIIYDMIIPAGKHLLMSVAESALRMILFNDQSRVGSYQNPQWYNPPQSVSVPRTSYSSFYVRQNAPNAQNQYAPASNYASDCVQVFPSRVDAESVLSELRNSLDEYQSVSVGDFYDLIGVSSSYVDFSYGWYELNSAVVRPVPGGFVIDFPKAVPLR